MFENKYEPHATDSTVIMNNFSVNNSNYVLSKDSISSFWTTEYIMLAVHLGTFGLIGVIGNIPVLIVYFHRKEKTASNTFIKALAILDLLVCSLVMPYTMVYELHLVQSDIICRSFEIVRHFSIFASSSTLVAISIERYIAVCRITHKMSMKNVQQGMFCIFVLSCIAAGPSAGIFTVVSQNEVNDVKCRFLHETTSGKFCHFTFSIAGEGYALMYQGFLMVSFFVSLIIIVIFYVIIYIVLWKRTQFRKRALSRTPRECSVNSEVHSSLCDNGNSQKPNHCENEISRTYDFENDDSDVINKEISNTNNNANVKLKLRKKEKVRRIYHRRTAKMLFLCTVIYLLTWLPFWIDIFGITDYLVFRYLFFVGNATNPIVYGIVNNQIRREFYKLLSRCFCFTGLFRVNQRSSLSV